MITPSQCRAARALLDISQKELATMAGVSETAIRTFESGNAEPRRATLQVLSATLKTAGVDFLFEEDGAIGVKLRKE